MALILQNNGLKGIFQGQGDNPVRIGNIIGQPDNNPVSPFVYGCFLGEDSIQMNVYFDPAASDMVRSHPDDYPKIGIIQMGRFQLNHLYLPYDFYQVDHLYPNTVKYAKLYGKNYPGACDWIDTPREKSNGKPNTEPTFPAWNYADSALTPLKTMFQYPNTYGGYVRYQTLNPYNYQKGENLCAYIQSNLLINSGNSPDFPMKLDLMDFLDSIDPERYSLEDTHIPSLTFSNRPDHLRRVVNELNRLEIIPFNFEHEFIKFPVSPKSSQLGTFQVYINSKIRYVVSHTRLYIEYYAGNLYPKDDDEPERIVLIPINDSFHYFKYSDDFKEDFNDARAQSGPDIPKIFDQIRAKYGYLASPYDELKLTYQMYTCACAIKVDEAASRAYIRLFEGFSWDISNEFTEGAEGWNNLHLDILPTTEADHCNYRRSNLKYTLREYYRKIFQNKDFIVEFV